MLTKTTKYAIRILVFMANEQKDKFSVKFLQQTLKIPMKYLSKLMTNLSKNGLVKSIQGRKGGFVLAKEPSEITIADIIEATEGMQQFNECILGLEDCSDNNPCALHYIWDEVKKILIPALKETTLEDLKKHKIKKF